MFLIKGHKNVYYVKYKKFDGKWTQKSTKTTDEDEANEFLKDFKEGHIQKRTSNTTVYQNSSLKHFFKDVISKCTPFYSKRDIRGLTKLTNRFIDYIGNKNIQDLSLLDIESYIAQRCQDTYRGHIVSKSTVNLDIRVLKMLFNRAIRWSLLEKNPCNGVKQFKIAQRTRISFTSAEIKLLVDVIQDQDLKRMVIFATLTGCRIGEIINLEWTDINFDKKFILIANKKDFQTKSRKVRQVPLSTILRNYLHDWYLDKNSNYVFPTERGFKSNGGNITKRFKAVLRKLNFGEAYCFHCLRHSFAVHFLQATGNVYYLKQILGHSDIKVTESYLIGISNQDLTNTINQMPRLVG